MGIITPKNPITQGSQASSFLTTQEGMFPGSLISHFQSNGNIDLKRYVGWIHVEGYLCGTGMLLTKNLVLTCAHLFVKQLESSTSTAKPTDITFYPGLDGDVATSNRFKVKNYMFPPEYITLKKEAHGQKNKIKRYTKYDYALLQLEEQVKFEVKNICLSPSCSKSKIPKRFQEQVTIIGYPLEGQDPNSPIVQVKCSKGSLYKTKQHLILHKASTQKGSSGAAILMMLKDKKEDQKTYVIGIHTGYIQNQYNHGICLEEDNLKRIMNFERQLMGQKANQISKLINTIFVGSIIFDPENKEVAQNSYAIFDGIILNKNKCSEYKTNNANCQVLLEGATFHKLNQAIQFEKKNVQHYYLRKYLKKDLEQSIVEQKSDTQISLSQFVEATNKIYRRFQKEFNVSEEEAFSCCLALSYYTSSEGKRTNRVNGEKRRLFLKNRAESLEEKMVKNESSLCISHWLFKALSYIPLHWGEVTRCVDLNKNQQSMYQVGHIVTWTQFSSSSSKKITQYFETKNTRFIIYSISGRMIMNYSAYGRNQSEVLFKPYSHFLILHKSQKEQHLEIHMREIIIGRGEFIVLWVDDNIFNPGWENKRLMESAVRRNPLLGIIPKISTQAALAFLNSELGNNLKENSHKFRVITDMRRDNEKDPSNAGARFIKQFLQLDFQTEILVFTKQQNYSAKHLKEFEVHNHPRVKLTTKTPEALKFLTFEEMI